MNWTQSQTVLSNLSFLTTSFLDSEKTEKTLGGSHLASKLTKKTKFLGGMVNFIKEYR